MVLLGFQGLCLVSSRWLDEGSILTKEGKRKRELDYYFVRIDLMRALNTSDSRVRSFAEVLTVLLPHSIFSSIL